MTVDEVKIAIAEIAKQDHFKIVNQVRRYVYSQDVAEDCVQDAYIASIEQRAQLTEQSNLKAWLTKVAIRKAYHCIRDYNRIMESCIKAYISLESSEAFSASEIMIADTVSSVLRSFPVRTREVMLLRYVDNLSFSEIATLLDMSIAAVRQTHYRAKRKLRQQLVVGSYGMKKSYFSGCLPLSGISHMISTRIKCGHYGAPCSL